MKPMSEDQIAALFRSAYGGDVNVELSETGMNILVQPANGGSVYARLEDAYSPVLAAFLGVHRTSATLTRRLPTDLVSRDAVHGKVGQDRLID